MVAKLLMEVTNNGSEGRVCGKYRLERLSCSQLAAGRHSR